PNTRAMVDFVRNGRHRHAEVTVIDRDTGARLTLLSLGARTIEPLGLTVIPNQLEIRRGGRTVPGPTGLAVIEVDPHGLGASAGFQAGDLITGVEGNSVSTPEELDRAVRLADLSRGVRLNLVRTNARGGVMRGYIDIIE
ncbi:MAG: PDZ domain-containing protein, partial [Phycisphaerales bacterium JB059]